MALVICGAVVTLTSASASASASASVANGGVGCSLSATVRFSPPLKNSGGGTGPSRIVAALSGCSDNSGLTISMAGFVGAFTHSPFRCAPLSEAGAAVSGRAYWHTRFPHPKSWTSVVSDDRVTGSFPGDTSIVLNLPPALAAGCATRKGVKTLKVTGTLSLGPACGHPGGPISVYPIGGAVICGARDYQPLSVTAGPDGALWFTNYAQASIGRMTTSGVTTFFPTGAFGPDSITTGPDGNLWFTDAPTRICCGSNLVATGASIGKMTPSGAVTLYPLSPGSPSDITLGPDGALWFTNDLDSIGRITTSGAMTIYRGAGIDNPSSLITGPDGALWFVDNGHWQGSGTDAVRVDNGIARITTSGVVTHMFTGPDITSVTSLTDGPDGNLWFTALNGDCQPVIIHGHHEADCFSSAAIGKMTTSGVVTSYPYSPGALSGPNGIVTGPDGNLWFTNSGLKPLFTIGRITTSGAITTYAEPDVEEPQAITTGPDGAPWFVDGEAQTLGRIDIP